MTPTTLRRWLGSIAAALALATPALADTDNDPDFGTPTLVQTRAGQLAVYAVGTGPRTLLFWPSLFADHTQYRGQAQALKSEYRMLFVDGPGHGRSSAQPAGSTVVTHAQAAFEVLDRFAAQRAVVIGTSWGGLIGAHMAHNQPERVQALVAISAALDTPPGYFKMSERMAVWGTRFMGRSASFADGVAESFFSATSLAKGLRGINEFKAALKTADTAALADVVYTVMVERESTLPWLAHIKVPTTIVAGSEDQNLPASTSRSYAQRMGGARFVEVPGTSHIPPIENPETINQIIREVSARQ